MGPLEDLQAEFQGVIPYYVDDGEADRVADIFRQQATRDNLYVLSNFDMSGIGKSRFYKEVILFYVVSWIYYI